MFVFEHRSTPVGASIAGYTTIRILPRPVRDRPKEGLRQSADVRMYCRVLEGVLAMEMSPSNCVGCFQSGEGHAMKAPIAFSASVWPRPIERAFRFDQGSGLSHGHAAAAQIAHAGAGGV